MNGNMNLKDFNEHWIQTDGIMKHKDKARNLRGKALEAYKQTLVLTEFQKKALTGLLLGDA